MSKIANLKKKVADLEKKDPAKAIPVYLELLAEMDKYRDELDIGLFNRAGDLMLKLRKTSEAVDCYERAVDHYTEGGFFNNAIALCNKILRTSPGRATVYYKLGRISAEKGFKGDAKQNFLEYADRMQKAGNVDEAFRALGEFADLCPDQTDIRFMLSDQLAKAGKKDDAIEQLQILHEQFINEGRGGDAQIATDRMKVIDPSAEPRSGGSHRKGKAGDLVFLDLSDTSPARRSVAKRATQGLKIIDPNAPGPDAKPQPKPYTPRPTPPPSPEVAKRATKGLKIIDIDEPIKPKYAPPAPSKHAPRSDDIGASSSLSIEPMMPEVGHSTSTSGSLLGFESTSLVQPTPPAAQVPDTGKLDFIMPDGAEAPPAPPVRSSMPFALVDDNLDISLAPTESRKPESASDLSPLDPGLDDFITPEPTLAAGRRSTILEPKSVETLQTVVDGAPEDWASRRALAEALLESGNREAGIHELETAMLGYERNGDLSAAMSVAEEIVRIDPESVKHHQKRVEYAYRTSDKGLLVASYLALADALFRGGQIDKSRTIYQRVVELSPDDARAQAALSTIPEEGMISAPADRRSTKDFKRPSKAMPAEKRTSGSQRSDSLVNLGDWLREESAPKDTRMVVAEVEPTGDEEADFADMLRKFKQGVAENVEDEDYQSHYDLGVAYKEMGLMDEAIAEFQKALRGPEGRLRTYDAIGQSFIEKEQYQMAATVLGRALAEKGADDEQLISVLYLMGRACEALGRVGEAEQYYQRVVVVDIRFRDVANRLKLLAKAAR